jgi:hypothetical protein
MALIDEVHLFIAPILVGGGQRMFPEQIRHPLELLDERRFGNGMVFVRYAVASRSRGANEPPESACSTPPPAVKPFGRLPGSAAVAVRAGDG